MFGFTDLLEICFHPQNVWHEYQDIIENVGFYTPPRNMFPPPKFWHEYQDRIENVFFFTYPRNMFTPPKCLVRI